LHYAVEHDRTKIAVFLISKNADINAKDNDERTPLHLAAAKGLTEMCRFLLEFQANLRAKDAHCWTALHHAVNENHMETATLLIKRGVDLYAEDHKFGRTALHLASEKGFADMAEMLIIRGADLQAVGDGFYSKTPLHLACIHGHKDVVLVLLQRGADPNALSGLLDKTPLHFATEKGFFEVVQLLLRFGADVNAMGKHVTIIRVLYLFTFHLFCCFSQTNGSSPLHLAAQFNQFNIMDLFLKHPDININIQGKHTTLGTPLHIACQFGHTHLVHLLCDYGADFSLVDENGHTPLHIACIHEHFDIVSLLIEKHANPTVLSLKRQTPIDCIKNSIVKEKMYQLTLTMKKLKEEENEEILKQKRIAEHKANILSQQLTMAKQKEFETKLLKEIRKNEFTQKLILICDKSGDCNALLKLYEEYADDEVNINEPLILVSHIANNPNYQNFRLPCLPAIAKIHDLRQIETEGDEVFTNNSLLAYSGKVPSAPALHRFATEIATLPGEEIKDTGESGQLMITDGNPVFPVIRGGFGGFEDDNSSITSLGSNQIGDGFSTLMTSNRTHATALTLAAVRGFYELVQTLLQWPGIEINITELNGNTALHNAALIGSRDICELLLLSGADNRLINHQGKTAANLTDKLSLQEIIRNPKLIANRRHLQNQILKSLIDNKKKLLLSTSLSTSEEEVGRNKTSKLDEEEVSLKELLEEKKFLLTAKDMITEYTSKSHFNSLPVIAPQFSNNIIKQLHQKESSKLDLSQMVLQPPFKTQLQDNSSLTLPDINPNNNKQVKQNNYATPSLSQSLVSSPRTMITTTTAAKHKYGNIPETFGGNRSDFFSVSLGKEEKEKEKEFSDLFSLQRRYQPTTFDSVKEWLEKKDFLWLFGYPCRSLTHSFRPHSTAHHPNPTIIEVDDRRRIVYLFAKCMNHVQRLFNLPSERVSFGKEQYLQTNYSPPKAIIETVTNEPTASHHLPEIEEEEEEELPTSTELKEASETSVNNSKPKENPFKKRLNDFLSFNNYCLLHHIQSLKPIHIPSFEDFQKLILFSNYCFVSLTYLLSFFHPDLITHLLESYLQWSKEDYEYYHHGYTENTKNDHNKQAPQPPFFEYRLYLLLEYEKEIYSLQRFFASQLLLPNEFIQLLLNLLKYSMIQSYETFLGFYYEQYPERHRHQHSPDFSYEPFPEQQKSSPQKKKVKSKKDKGTVDDKEEVVFYEDPLKKKWSELIVNPPRSLRNIVDVFYELSTHLTNIMERFFPQDVVRSHLWLVEANQLLESLLNDGKQRLLREEQLKQKLKLVSSPGGGDGGVAGEDSLLLEGGDEASLVDNNNNFNSEENIPVSLTPLQCWLYDLQLLEYENFFVSNGFKILEDFQELSHDDCYLYFPFLKVGDLRRLSKNILNLNDRLVKHYVKKCSAQKE
jgi:ankyrin repeat protein